MTVLDVRTSVSWLGTSGTATVSEGERALATAEMTAAGWLSRRVEWTWIGAFGPEWTLHIGGGEREYDVRRPDGAHVGGFARPLGSSRLTVTAVDGQMAQLEPRRAFDRSRLLRLPDDRRASYERTTPTFTFSTAESWRVTLPDDLAEPMRTLALAVVFALDSRRRRQERAAAGGGA